MIAEAVADGSWIAHGDGYDTPIVAEGGTRQEAVHNFTQAYGDQYAAAQSATHLSLVESGQYE